MSLFKRSRHLFVIILGVITVGIIAALPIVNKAEAASTLNVTGNITNTASSSISGAYVYATTPGTNTIMYGPVATTGAGAYTLLITEPGAYDLHFDPPANSSYTPIVDTQVSVTGNLTVNKQLQTKNFTLTGTVVDNDGQPIAGLDMRIYKNGSSVTTQATTNASGAYSLTAAAGMYYLYMNSGGSVINGIQNFTMSQSNTNPSINLTNSNLNINMVLKTATVTATAYNNAGQPWQYGTSITAFSKSGFAQLYPGDPGTNISLINSTVTQPNGSATGTFKTIVGATYAASGLDASDRTSSICETTSSSPTSVVDCLRLPLTVMNDTSVDLPSSSAATRTYSGILTDASGAPIPNVNVGLIKYGDASTATATNASGYFSIQAQPGKYYLKVSGGQVGDIFNFTLTQSSANPTIDLTNNNIVQNLQLKNTSLTATARTSSGSPDYFKNVSAVTSAGTTTLYTGDPGESINVTSTGFNTSSNTTGQIGTLIGAIYSAKGLNATNTTGSICKTIATPNTYDCLTTSLTVTGPANINVPQ